MTTSAAPRTLVALLTLLVAAVLAGCSVDIRTGGSDEDGSGHNHADVEFASGMVPHHEQALMMVRMASGRPVDDDLARLMRQMADVQADEIDTMIGWLDDWGEERGHMHGDHGMLSMGDMHDLGRASDADFQRVWLESMIVHHEGAIAMAETEQDDGEFDPAIDLAEDIVESQTAEIETMREMLDR